MPVTVKHRCEKCLAYAGAQLRPNGMILCSSCWSIIRRTGHQGDSDAFKRVSACDEPPKDHNATEGDFMDELENGFVRITDWINPTEFYKIEHRRYYLKGSDMLNNMRAALQRYEVPHLVLEYRGVDLNFAGCKAIFRKPARGLIESNDTSYTSITVHCN